MSLLLAGGAVPETITVDKWYKQHDNPIRKGLQAAAIVSSFFFVDAPAQAEVVTVDKWYQPISQPTKKIVQANGWQTFLDVPRTVLLTDWFQAASEPYFSKKRNYLTGEFKFEVPREVLLSDWFQAIVQPYFKKGTHQESARIIIEVEVQPDLENLDWFREIVQPYLKAKSNLAEFVFEVPFIEEAPPVPPPSGGGGGGGEGGRHYKDHDKENKEWEKRLREDDNDIMILLKIFFEQWR